MSKTIFVNYVTLATEKGERIDLKEESYFYDLEGIKKECKQGDNVFNMIYKYLDSGAPKGASIIIRNIQILEI